MVRGRIFIGSLLALLAASALCAGVARAQARTSVALEDLTWTEVRDLVRAGAVTIIIPVGGVEQSGPHMALGKHDVRVGLLADRIARSLGKTLVAPVVAYVPEGSVEPPTGHMRFPGTITVPDAAFRMVVASAAMSFQHAGFRDIVLIGDHGGYQADLKAVADQLNRSWAKTPARAHYIAAYYAAAQAAYAAELRRRGYGQAEIGTHAGLADTSLSLALDPRLVRSQALAQPGSRSAANGVYGDPRRASPALGQLGIVGIVRATTAAIRAEQAGR